MENTQYDDNDALAEEVDQQNNELYDSSEEISDEEENSDPLNTLEDKIEPDVEKNSLKNVGSSNSIKAPREKIIFNITDAKYEVIKLAGKKDMKWTLSTKPGDGWDVLWQDKTIAVETLAKMLPYQKINHFPGMLSIARKNTLGKNLMKMNKLYPDKYKFFPKTYLLPSDYQDFKNQFNSSKPKTFIIKPEAGSQGRGIFLTNKLDSVTKQDRCVAQKYLTDPYLIDGLKFDLRLYVLIAGCDPLRIFLHKQGLGRFATEPYVAPTEENMENVCMHLTNYAINKDSPNFVFNEGSDADDVGHKKSLTAVFKILKDEGHDTDKLWREIKKIIIKTFCSIQPILAHNYRSCHPNEPYNNMCFEVLGFDIMLDSKIKPWLIEVNHLPSFTTDTPLDQSIKRKVVGDALKIMNVSSKARVEYKTKRKAELHQRTISSKKTKITPEERQALFESAQKERDEWEAVNHGEFERIYPLSEEEREAGKQQEYEEYILAAKQDWQAWTGTEVKKPVKPNKKLDVSQEPPTIDTENPAAKAWNGNTKLTTATPTTTTQTTSASSLATTKFPSRAQSRPATSITSRSTNNDLSTSAAVSHRTATSSRMDNREAPIGPWCDEHITEYSDGDSFDSGQMNPNKEHNNHDILEDEPVTRLTKQEKLQLDYQNHLLYQKERQPKPTPTLQEEPLEDLSSSRYLTNRARTPKTRNDIMNKSVSNSNSNMKKTESQPQSANKTSYNSRPYTSSVNRSITPADDRRKKFLFNDNKKTTKEAKSPDEVKELKDAFDAKSKKYTPSTKYSRVSGLNKSRNPKSPTRSGESSPAGQDTSNAASPSPKHTRNETASSLHKREYNVSKQNSVNYPRYVSPKREANNLSRDIVKKLEFSVGPPAVNQRPATAVKKENASSEQEKRRTGSPISRPQTVYKDNKKPQSKASEISVQNVQLNTKLAKPKPKDAPEAKNQPVNITLSLSKKHMRPNMAELEEKMKKVWPTGGLGIAKPSVAKLEPQFEQPLVSQVLSPQYYRVKLSKDPSGLEVHTVTLAPPKKTITKSASNRLKDISIQEIDSIGLAHNLLNHSTSRSILMDVLATPKVA